MLAQILKGLPFVEDPNVLVGTETLDDAAVYRLGQDTLFGERALVATVDFFTPVTDDPYHFGKIAAANAMSDVYAMGGEPLFALNILMFPFTQLPLDVCHAVVKGGLDMAREAGIAVIGGHSVDDPEPKYGMVVIGQVDVNRLWRNKGAKPHDHLLLTKPLGVGIQTTAIKRGLATHEQVERVTRLMETLNRDASRVAQRVGGVHAATDVTGFGLLGHLLGMVGASGVGAHLYSGAIPLLAGTRQLAEEGVIPGGTKANLAHVADKVVFEQSVDGVQQLILADAQTSGGLLLAVHPDSSAEMVRAMEAEGVSAHKVGEMVEGEVGTVAVKA